MGDPKKTKKHFDRPRKPWAKERIESEKELKKKYGLRRNNEIWRMKQILRNKRHNARMLLALPLEQRLKREKELMDSLFNMGLLPKEATLDDVLSMGVDSIMERRLQTMVIRQGLANSLLQARQFITHGHISIFGKKVTSPSYIVGKKDEKQITYYGQKMELTPKISKASADKGEETISARDVLKKKFEEVKEAAEKMEKEIEGGTNE